MPQNQINLVLQGSPLGQTLLTGLKDVVADCNVEKEISAEWLKWINKFKRKWKQVDDKLSIGTLLDR